MIREDEKGPGEVRPATAAVVLVRELLLVAGALALAAAPLAWLGASLPWWLAVLGLTGVVLALGHEDGGGS